MLVSRAAGCRLSGSIGDKQIFELAGRYREHRHWMIRSFSLIMAGVMLRLWTLIYGGLAAVGIVDFTFETAYAGIAWLCWVPNLLLAIWFTRRPADVVNAA